MAFEVFFLPAGTGRRFCLLHAVEAGVPVQGAVVYVHPFAEEMNKARRMAALQARALAVAGYAVLQIDLHGCGDSSGDFGDASWQGWIDDVLQACDWLARRSEAPLWLWGLRAGCLLAAGAARRSDAVGGLLFWQPVLSGKRHLQQFLRLKSAGDMLSGDGAGSLDRLKADLARGQAVEIAGYTLAPGLASGLESAELALPERALRVEWLEIAGAGNDSPSPAAASQMEKWRAQGHAVRRAAVRGASFWRTAEIAETPELIAATLEVIGSGDRRQRTEDRRQ
ncbi:MAG: hydrolase 2, exosortase A system-associated [Candidatus Accumulibacter sp.]|jgi:exosortase A-associated hydrolase 2|nr:hydrolase 2, exosortase A system-associated [Accumulibacter sp.]